MNYFIFNGIDSKSFKSLIVNELDTIVRPAEKLERFDIPLYNGQMINETGFYETTIRNAECTLKDLSELDEILKWLRGSGHVVFSNQPDRYYMTTIVNNIPFSRVIKQLRKFTIQFECQPFGYLTEGKDTIRFENSDTLVNPGTVESEPIIKIIGSGDMSITIGDCTFEITNVDQYITVDVPLMEVYKDNRLMNKLYVGDFPMLKVGENNISWLGTDIKAVEIIPNWRCL